VQIYALVDRDRNGTADSKVNVIQGIDTPTGVAWRAPSSLFVSGFQDGKGLIWRYDGVDAAALAGARRHPAGLRRPAGLGWGEEAAGAPPAPRRAAAAAGQACAPG
jgi:hypothetical protein